jgi:hypothetical protein
MRRILKASDRYTFHGDARLFTFVYGVRVRTKSRPNSCLIFYYVVRAHGRVTHGKLTLLGTLNRTDLMVTIPDWSLISVRPQRRWTRSGGMMPW